MSELLIPFGIHRENGGYIEPEDAVSGRACNCLCPGCKAPLLSRHSKALDRRSYFAHDSKHKDAKPEEECPFSSSVAVAMMIRYLAEQYTDKVLQTPQLDALVYCEACHEQWQMVVTTAGHVVIEQAQANLSEQSCHFDIKLVVNGVTLYLELIYKGKPPATIQEPELLEQKAGVLALSCDNFSLAKFNKNRNIRFTEAVMAFVLEEAPRQWRFHPRQALQRHKVLKGHECHPFVDVEPDSESLLEPGYPFELEHFAVAETPSLETGYELNYRESFAGQNLHCIQCDKKWVGKGGVIVCPHCHSPLYVKSLG